MLPTGWSSWQGTSQSLFKVSQRNGIKHCRKLIFTVKAPSENRRKLKIGKSRKLTERQKNNKANNIESTCHCRVIYFKKCAAGS